MIGMSWRSDTTTSRKIALQFRRLRRVTPELRSNVGLGGCEPPQPPEIEDVEQKKPDDAGARLGDPRSVSGGPDLGRGGHMCKPRDKRGGRSAGTRLSQSPQETQETRYGSAFHLQAQDISDGLSNPLRGGLDIAVGEMGVAQGHADIGVAEHP